MVMKLFAELFAFVSNIDTVEGNLHNKLEQRFISAQ